MVCPLVVAVLKTYGNKKPPPAVCCTRVARRVCASCLGLGLRVDAHTDYYEQGLVVHNAHGSRFWRSESNPVPPAAHRMGSRPHRRRQWRNGRGETHSDPDVPDGALCHRVSGAGHVELCPRTSHPGAAAAHPDRPVVRDRALPHRREHRVRTDTDPDIHQNSAVVADRRSHLRQTRLGAGQAHRRQHHPASRRPFSTLPILSAASNGRVPNPYEGVRRD
ncbi:low molecular weight protein antigen 6 [Mycobacteroides abscessus]|nr:low molecular weight protein antigen 6 [Mycobacteroides abscessus]